MSAANLFIDALNLLLERIDRALDLWERQITVSEKKHGYRA